MLASSSEDRSNNGEATVNVVPEEDHIEGNVDETDDKVMDDLGNHHAAGEYAGKMTLVK